MRNRAVCKVCIPLDATPSLPHAKGAIHILWHTQRLPPYAQIDHYFKWGLLRNSMMAELHLGLSMDMGMQYRPLSAPCRPAINRTSPCIIMAIGHCNLRWLHVSQKLNEYLWLIYRYPFTYIESARIPDIGKIRDFRMSSKVALPVWFPQKNLCW